MSASEWHCLISRRDGLYQFGFATSPASLESEPSWPLDLRRSAPL